MHEPATALHTVDLASLGERLSALRLCDAASLTAVRRSLEQHGQLTALTVFGSRDQLEVLDGFKRARAARARLADAARARGRGGLRRSEAAPVHAA